MNIRNTFFILAPFVFMAFGFYLKCQNAGEDILLKAINISLQSAHYNPVEMDDAFSEKAFELYLDNMDGNKRLLLQSDVDAMERYKHTIDDEIEEGTYNMFEKSLEVMNRQISATEGYFEEILAQQFDFEKEEDVSFDEDLPYAKTSEGLKERWRKYLKYNVMTRLYSDQLAQEKALEKSDTVEAVTLDSMEAKARRNVLKTHRDWYTRLKRLERKDRLSMYVNSITAVYDPHTNYFPPADKENFDIQMSGQLEGIGAQLQEKDGYIKITKIIPGGPSSLQGELEASDLILKVKQEDEELPVDIIDWRINDAVKIIRGKKGTKVTLTVKKLDGSIKDITITRDVVVLEETYAKSLILSDKDNLKSGYIYLPSFYADFRNPRGRFSWKDVKAEIEKLKEANVKGIILDLRNNGGGSLDDVVKMGGLFIDQGPIVQVKEKGRKAQVLEDRYAGTDWDGALVILVNEFSASASEIMAAAMQDYNRAVIVGSSSTHGKGTVQRFLALNRALRSKDIPDLGSVKLTIQKFYRINGDATQLKGVNSDILLPDNYMYIKTGEKEHEFAMEWDQIESSDYDAKQFKISDKVIKKSQTRVKKSETFQLVEQNARRWEQQREDNVYSLNLKAYSIERAQEKEENKNFDALKNIEIDGFVVENIPSEVEYMNAEKSRKKRNEEWIKSINKDPYVYEALQVIEDLN